MFRKHICKVRGCKEQKYAGTYCKEHHRIGLMLYCNSLRTRWDRWAEWTKWGTLKNRRR